MAFFIDRPIFAWVVALFICLIGLIAIPLLPIAQYPIIAPPSISISTSYPGASPENLYNSVTRLIEEELNGAPGILNFESTSDSLGQVEIIANFVPGTDPALASVEVQNRIKRVEARLPRAVIQQGILIEEASSAVLQIITLSLDRRQPRRGRPRRLHGAQRPGRDPAHPRRRPRHALFDRARAAGLDRSGQARRLQPQRRRRDRRRSARRTRRSPPAASAPSPVAPGQPSPRWCWSRASSARPRSSARIVLRANPDGSTVRLRDVARIEIGGMSYQFTTRLNGKPTAGLVGAAGADRQCAGDGRAPSRPR